MENSQDLNNTINSIRDDIEEVKELVQNLVEKQEETIEYVQKSTESIIEVLRGKDGMVNVGSDKTDVDMSEISRMADALSGVEKNLEEVSARLAGVELNDGGEENILSGDIKITGLVGGVIKYDKEEEYEIVKKAVLKEGDASIEFIQKKLSMSKEKANDFVDMLEERCVVGKNKGSKPREIIEDKD